MIGGWEETLAKGIGVNSMDHSKVLFGTELLEKSRRTKGVNRSVSDKHLFSSIRNDSIEALKTFMMRGMCFDDILNWHHSAFTNFCATAEDIRNGQININIQIHSRLLSRLTLILLFSLKIIGSTDNQLMDWKRKCASRGLEASMYY